MPRRKTISDDAILAAARSLFLKEGIRASTRTLAQQANISEAVIFQRFGTKEDLFFAAMVPPQAQLKMMFDAHPGQRSVQANLNLIGSQIVAYFCEIMPVFLTLISHPSFDMQTFLQKHRMPAIQIEQELLAYLSAEAKLGRICKEGIDATTKILISRLHHLALSKTIDVQSSMDTQQEISDAIDLLWRGLVPR